MLFSSLVPSLVHILAGLVGLALACFEPVFRSAVLAHKFVSTEAGADLFSNPVCAMLAAWRPLNFSGRRCNG